MLRIDRLATQTKKSNSKSLRISSIFINVIQDGKQECKRQFVPSYSCFRSSPCCYPLSWIRAPTPLTIAAVFSSPTLLSTFSSIFLVAIKEADSCSREKEGDQIVPTGKDQYDKTEPSNPLTNETNDFLVRKQLLSSKCEGALG